MEIPAVQVDEAWVRWKAARLAFVMAGGVDCEGPFWERWRDRGETLARGGGYEELAEHYERAVREMGPEVEAFYERRLVWVRRNAERNAARGHFAGGPSRNRPPGG